MSPLDIAAVVGTAIGSAVAAWEAKLSPRAKARKQDREAQRQFYADWNGTEERRGPTGNLIASAQPGVMERLGTLELGMVEIHTRVDVPILNGSGERLIAQVDEQGKLLKRVDNRTKVNSKRLLALEQRGRDR